MQKVVGGTLFSEANAAPAFRREALWQNISQRRATNMRLLAMDIVTTGKLRKELSEAAATDIIWSMNSPKFYLLLVGQRGWSPEEFERWLAESWVKLLLEWKPEALLLCHLN